MSNVYGVTVRDGNTSDFFSVVAKDEAEAAGYFLIPTGGQVEVQDLADLLHEQYDGAAALGSP